MRNTFTFALWSKTRQARMIDEIWGCWATPVRALKARAWVCGLIQKHEGRLEVSSQPGKAARFGFAFP